MEMSEIVEKNINDMGEPGLLAKWNEHKQFIEETAINTRANKPVKDVVDSSSLA
jgi:hypothetical protein